MKLTPISRALQGVLAALVCTLATTTTAKACDYVNSAGVYKVVMENDEIGRLQLGEASSGWTLWGTVEGAKVNLRMKGCQDN